MTTREDEMYEQTAYFGPVSLRHQAQAGIAITRRQGRATDDVALPDDEDPLYEMRSPTSVRRYHAPPQTEIRVTRHQGIPPRASQKQHPPPQPQARPRRRIHWFFFVGVGMLAMLLLYYSVEGVSALEQRLSDNAHYGYPRTFQCDANVEHSGVSHFIVENLHGHVFIIEMPMNHLNASRMYAGPVLTGADADLVPATVTFHDVNGDRLPDMLLTVGTARYIFLNTGQEFRPANANDHIMLGGM
jgi:hypothetical protein